MDTKSKNSKYLFDPKFVLPLSSISASVYVGLNYCGFAYNLSGASDNASMIMITLSYLFLIFAGAGMIVLTNAAKSAEHPGIMKIELFDRWYTDIILCFALIAGTFCLMIIAEPYYNNFSFLMNRDFPELPAFLNVLIWMPIFCFFLYFYMISIRHLKSRQLRWRWISFAPFVWLWRLFSHGVIGGIYRALRHFFVDIIGGFFVRLWRRLGPGLVEDYKRAAVIYQKETPFGKKLAQKKFVVLGLYLAVFLVTLITFSIASSSYYSLSFFGAVTFFFIPMAVEIMAIAWAYREIKVWIDLNTLLEGIHEISTVNINAQIVIPETSPFYAASQELMNIGNSLNISLEKQMKSEKMKVDLITNVSHDLKTPLTSIISYIDLLSKDESLTGEAADYVDILKMKASRLRDMVLDLFDLAKSTSGNVVLDMEELDMCKLLEQTLVDMDDKIQASGMPIKVNLTEESAMVYADGKKMYRVIQNLIENALKYSMRGTRIFLDLYIENHIVYVMLKNTAGYEMNFSADVITERFTRGDENRSTEGNGLGLAIAKSFTENCGGSFKVIIDGDLFKAILKFPEHKSKPVQNADAQKAADTGIEKG